MRDFAIEMATDIVDVNVDHPGVLSCISRMFKQFDTQITIDLDQEFNTLFPVEDLGLDYKKDKLNTPKRRSPSAIDHHSFTANFLFFLLFRNLL